MLKQLFQQGVLGITTSPLGSVTHDVGNDKIETSSCSKHNIIGILVDAVDCQSAVERVIDAAKAGCGMAVSALAVHGVMTGVLNPIHRYRLNRLDLIVPDGQPVRWALNWLHRTQLPARTPGRSLMLEICRRAEAESLPIYLYGSTADVLADLSKELLVRFPKLKICGMQPSRFRKISPQEKEKVVKDIRDSGAAIVFVGLGCPRQEVWAYEYRDDLSVPVIALGAAFDFIAGRLTQPPSVLQDFGLEWLYRLLQEPTRLWRRYVLLNPLYLFLLILQLLKLKNFDPSDATRPEEELLYG